MGVFFNLCYEVVLILILKLEEKKRLSGIVIGAFRYGDFFYSGGGGVCIGRSYRIRVFVF